MRPLDAIREEISAALAKNDSAALFKLSDEALSLDTVEARATSASARGNALLFTGHYQEAYEALDRAYQLCLAAGDEIGAAHQLGSMGTYYMRIGKIDLALTHYQRGLETYQRLNSIRSIAVSNTNIGAIYERMGQFGDALAHYQRALDLNTTIGDNIRVAKNLGAMGTVYGRISEHHEALEHYERALSISIDQGDVHTTSVILLNIGNVYSAINNVEQALEYYGRCEATLTDRDDPYTLAYLLMCKGYVLDQDGEHASALEHYNRALSLHNQIGDAPEASLLTCNLVATMIKTGDLEAARGVQEQHRTMDLSNPDVRAQHHSNQALIHEHDGDVDAARASLTTALTIADTAGLRARQAAFHERLRDLARKTGDFDAYVEHNDAYLKVNEEIRGQEATRKLAMAEAQRHINAERIEKEKHRALLHSTLPPSIADRVLRGEQVNDFHAHAAVLFMDIVGFTKISSTLSASEVVAFLEQLFSSFDAICERHNVTKIKTIGDSYMAVAFDEQPNDRTTEQPNIGVAERIALAALDMISAVSAITLPNGSREGSPVRVRLGVHCGALTAGVIGTQRLQYDVWGDTVNVASRLESTGEPGRIHVSEDFALALEGERAKQRNSDPGTWHLAPGTWHLALRGDTELKGKGTVTTYWLEQYT